MQACVGMAGKADLAILAARAATPVLVLKDNASHGELLKQLPVSVLNLMPDEARLLQLWGICTLAQLIARSRCGSAVMHSTCASGKCQHRCANQGRAAFPDTGLSGASADPTV